MPEMPAGRRISPPPPIGNEAARTWVGSLAHVVVRTRFTMATRTAKNWE